MYRWLLYTCAAFRELWRTNPWDPRATLLFLKTNRLGHVLFPSARWQHCWYAQTALCIPDILCCFDCVLTVFDDWYSVPFVKNSQKTVKIAKITIAVPIVTGLPRLYQQCTNRKNSQNSTKMTIGVRVVTCLTRLYQPCTNRVPKTVKRQLKQQK